jgi:uncharacterized membrane protein HdeD (DUF308 family)
MAEILPEGYICAWPLQRRSKINRAIHTIMFRLALILLGSKALAGRWKTFWIAGILVMLAGAGIWLDLADGVADLATSVLGMILLIEGLAMLMLAAAHAPSRRRFERWRGAAMIVFACLILDFPWDNSIATWVLIAGAFVFDGMIRIASSLLIRYARWRRSCLLGGGALVLAALLITDWPLPRSLNMQFCIGLGLIVSGYLIARGALELKRLAGMAHAPAHGAAAAGGKREMVVHVWAATGGLDEPMRLPIIERYIAAVSRKGAVSTGHAALECGAGIYISHHPREPMIITRGDFLARVRATRDNDVPGKWFPSYREEEQAECPSTYRIRFRTFNQAALDAFWNNYRRDTTYNLTARNCSFAVARAIDAAVEGVFADKPFWPTLLRLALHSDMWIAGRARTRAASMSWTPGLVLDYATALRRITHPRHGLAWRNMLRLPRLRMTNRLNTEPEISASGQR